MTLCGYDTCKYNIDGECMQKDRVLDVNEEDNLVCLDYARSNRKVVDKQ